METPAPRDFVLRHKFLSPCIVLSLDSAQGCRLGDWEFFSAHGKSTCGEGESCFNTTSSNRDPWHSMVEGVAGISAGTAAVVTGNTRGELRTGSVTWGMSGDPNGGLLWLPNNATQSRSPGTPHRSVPVVPPSRR